jgi:peptidoglycan/xylan/chitin deacetylase (PgdA/CDA1 family)
MRAILTWHSIDPSGSPISVSREEFERQLAWLERAGVRVVALEELVELSDAVDAAALTFDDGLASVAGEAVPALDARGWSAAVFVVTARVGLDNRWPGADDHVPAFPTLGWESLGKLQEQGFTIGSHTRHHPRLPLCEADVLEEEVVGAAQDIQARLGSRPRVFAYPYGELDARSAALAAATYRWACTTEIRALGAGESEVRLPRIDGRYLRGVALRQQWGSPALRSFFRWRRALRTMRLAVLR